VKLRFCLRGYFLAKWLLHEESRLTFTDNPSMWHVRSGIGRFLTQVSQCTLKCPKQLPEQVTLQARRLSPRFQIRNQLALI